MRTRIIAATIGVLLTLTACETTSADTTAHVPTEPPSVDLIEISPTAPRAVPPSQETVTVRSVYDGDTYTLTDDRKVRILGIDTPEMRADPADPNDTPEQAKAKADAQKCYGHEARDAAAALLVNQQVTITADPEQSDHDMYGRILRYVTLPDGSDLGARLLDIGAARVYRQYPVTKTASYDVFEHQAQQLGTGGWAACGWDK